MKALLYTNVRDNKGLFVDAVILGERLIDAGYDVHAVDFRDPMPSGVFDLGIACEVIPTPEQFNSARRWMFVPNPEWCDESKLARLPEFDRVLLKTPYAVTVADWGPGATFVGFESLDVGGKHPDLPLAGPRMVLHPCGSIARGGVAVVRAWKLVCARELHGGATLLVIDPPPYQELQENLKSSPRTIVHARLPESQVRELQRRSEIHVIPSEHEGHGHAFWEGLSCGAQVIGSDGPWWDHLAPGSFVRVRSSAVGSRMLSARHIVDIEALAVAIAEALESPGYVAAARTEFEYWRDDFRVRFARVLAEPDTIAEEARNPTGGQHAKEDEDQ